jgi:hypothetical protein
MASFVEPVDALRAALADAGDIRVHRIAASPPGRGH